MAKLVICEKNNAAQRISAILSGGKYQRSYYGRTPIYKFEREGSEYVVVGLRGHIIELDYPKKFRSWSLGNLNELIFVEPVKNVHQKSIAGALKITSKDAEEIIVSTDYDREGELIGVEAIRVIADAPSVKKGKLKRAHFSAITKPDIDRAFSELEEINYNLANAAECRQVIDLAWGATLTRFISLASNRTGKNFLSVGRVQSPTLALLVDRDKAIKEFVPKPYWLVKAEVEGESRRFMTEHETGQFWSKKDAEKALGQTQGAKTGKVTDSEVSEKNNYPPPPFNTTLFLADASRIGFSAARAMKIAEDLYTRGFISYPRTDNTVYPKTISLKSILNRLLESDFKDQAEELLAQERIKPSKGKMLTRDHPPIHPVNGATKRTLKGDNWRIYELIVQRFLATVAPSAIIKETNLVIDINGEKFKADGAEVISRGWMRYYPLFKAREVFVPVLKKGSEVKVHKVSMEDKETEPPRRYSEGTLVKQMEELGLGTKSTRHEIIQKLYDRGYVQGPQLIPTETGVAVISSLEAHADTITKPDMTSSLEKEMKEIEEGEKTLAGVVNDSQNLLEKALAVLKENEQAIGKDINEALAQQHNLGKCECGGDLGIRRGRNGSQFIGCSKYPKCSRTYPLPKNASISPTSESCEECGRPVIKVSIRGQSSDNRCIDADCKKNLKIDVLAKCRCGGKLRVRQSRSGKRFVGCMNYPNCKVTYPLPQKGKVVPMDIVCKDCKSPVIKIISKGKSPWILCINIDCPAKKEEKAPKQKKSAKAKK